MKKAKRILSLLLAAMMVVSLAACGKKNNTTANPTDSVSQVTPGEEQKTEPKTYTYRGYSSTLGSNWNPHTWENSADSSILGYISTPFVDLQVDNSEEGLYQWVYEMATSVTDVTKDHQDDLTRFAVNLPAGTKASDVTEGFIFDIALNKNAKWEDGTPINADSYIYSMKALLDPAMQNYRANNYWSGESAVAGAKNYYYQGTTATLDNFDGSSFAYAGLADLTKGADGVYCTPEGGKVYIALNVPLNWTSGDTLKDYVDYFGEKYFALDTWEQLLALMDAETGLVPLTDESYQLFVPVTTTVEAWSESEEDVPGYWNYEKTFDKVDYSTVGCYKVDDYTIRYVNENRIDRNYFLTSLTSNWLVNEKLYESLKEEKDGLLTTTYCTSKETSMSYGPYKISSLQTGKQIVFVQNENWYGFTKQADGSLISMTSSENFKVDGKDIQQYKTTSVIIDVMDDNTAKQVFLKGNLSSWAPTAEELVNYSTSDQLYKQDETYTMRFFFNTDVDALKTMDSSKGNQNSVVLSNYNFRKAMSLAIDRAEFVTATPGYKPACFILNGLYYYNVYDDPSSIYRDSDEAMQAICDLYGVEYGEGKAYATLKDAYKSINGYNLTLAKEYMTKACQELVDAGLYTKGEDIKIRIGWAKGAIESADQAQVAILNKQLNAALEGTGFGKITLEAIGNLEDRYKAVPDGEFAIGYGAWGGAAFYPFTMFQVYCDPSYTSIHERACWSPDQETLTLTVNGQEETMTWQQWSKVMAGSEKYAGADFKTKLGILANLEENYLKKYYCIPICGTTICEMLSYQVKYYTEDYNIMYGFGGLRLMDFNYDDAAWEKAVADQGGTISYE